MKIVYSKQFKKSFDRLFSYNPIYLIPRLFRDAKMEIRHAWQRIFRGFDDTWWWSLHNVMSEVIPKCVRKMRKDGCGYPSGITYKQWKVILKKIEIGFEAANKLDDCPYNGKRYKQRMKKYEEGMQLFSKHFFSLWD